MHGRLLCLGLAFVLITAWTNADEISNDAVTLQVQKDGSLSFVTGGGQPENFRPHFLVLRREDDPGHKDLRKHLYQIPAWTSVSEKKLSTDPFQSGISSELFAEKTTLADGVVTWHFPDQPDFQLAATARLEKGSALPIVEFHLTAKTPGWYSVAYTGAPEIPPADATAIWQPMLWCERRFPETPILSTEDMCPLPAVLVESKGVTFGVAADLAELPFRLPTEANAVCGVAVRDAQGMARPMLFAPVFGRPGSQLAAGAQTHFRLRLIARHGDWYSTLRDLATGAYRLADVPENVGISLNQTLENEIAFAMNDDKSGWLEEYKGFDYTTDVKNTVKVVSALDPVSIAVVTDNEAIWQRRGLPTTEFLLSRTKYLFSIKLEDSVQNGVRKLDGPTGEVFEWASLSAFAHGNCAAFIDAAHRRLEHPRALNLAGPAVDGDWIHDLAMYRMTGDKASLDKAVAGATQYMADRIDRKPEDFSGLIFEAQFWTDFTPRWMSLLELYETTGDKRFLDGAVYGARLYASLCWMSPPIPAGNVDIDGMTGPAWRVSQIGLTPEACNTARPNAAIFMSEHAPWMLRLAYLSGDPFLRTIARHAVIGRYANFPGYTVTKKFSLAYTTPDYPLTLKDKYFGYSQMYLNHVWPHIAMLMDYLMSEAWARSATAVDFPSEYAQGYVYLQSKVYGARPGKFYGDTGIMPYMPAGLVSCDSPQINYVAGRKDGALYLAFMNESDKPLRFRATLNAAKAGIDSTKTYSCRVWKENVVGDKTELREGSIALDISPRGITGIAVDGAAPKAAFQDKVASSQAPKLGPTSVKTVTADFGPVHASLLSLGQGLTSAYLWTPADEKQIVSAHLRWRAINGTWHGLDDAIYPFEFSVPLDDVSSGCEFEFSGKSPAGVTITAPPVVLKP